jgi:hypothetical protein
VTVVHYTIGKPWHPRCGAAHGPRVPTTVMAQQVTCEACIALIPRFADIADDPEDRRITKIGQVAMTGKTVAFVTDSEPADKVERYIRKLTERFPDIEVIDRMDGPVQGSVTVKVRKKAIA